MKKYPYQIRMIVILFFIWGTINLFRMSLNFLFPFIAVDFSINEAMLSVFTAWISAFWALGVFVSGKITDYFHEYIIFISGCALIIIGAAIIKSGTSLPVLYAAFALFGFGGGIQGPTCIVMLNRYGNPKRLGTSLGLVQASSGLLGLTLGATVMTAAGENLGWRQVYGMLIGYVILFGTIIFFMFHKRFRKPREASLVAIGSSDGFWTTWRYRNIKVISLVCVLIFSWSMLVSAYVIVFLTSYRGLDMIAAGSVVGALGLGGFVGTIILTSLSDYLGRKWVTIVCITASTVAFFFLAFVSISYSMMLLAMFILGLTCQGLLALISGVIPSESVPEHLINKAASLVPTLGELIGSVGISFFSSFLVLAFGSDILFKGLIVLPLGAIIACFFLKETVKK